MLDEVLEVVASSAVHAHEEARAAARLALRAEARVADVQGEVDRLDAHVEALTRALREYLRADSRRGGLGDGTPPLLLGQPEHL